MILRYVKEYQNNQKFSEDFKMQLINSTVYVFLIKPRETLPILT